VVVVVVVVVEDSEVGKVALLAPEFELTVEDESADPEADFVTLLEVRVEELFEATTVEDAALFEAEMVGLLEDIAGLFKPVVVSDPEGINAEEDEIPEGGLAEESTKLVDARVAPPFFEVDSDSTG